MRRVLIVIGVLSSGTALSFGAAAAIMLASPDAKLVPNTMGFNGVNGVRPIAVPGKIIVDPGIPAPMPMPAIDVPNVGALPPDKTGVAELPANGEVVIVDDKALPPQSGTQP